MKKIDVSTPKHPSTFTLVEDSDFEELNNHKWGAYEHSGKLYAQRNVRIDGKWATLYMHTAIMGHTNGKKVDHRNGNTLDNQRHNLRHCTHAENARNRGAQRNNTSSYKGVGWHKRDSKWQANIKLNGKDIHLGNFTCLIKAAKAYDTAAMKYFGEFARVNFPAN